MQTPSDSFMHEVMGDTLLVAPTKLDHFVSLIRDMRETDDWKQAVVASIEGQRADDFWADEWLRPYSVENGTLTIPVKGALLNNFGYQLGRWATGYTYIQKAYERGMSDPNVQRIALDISSPGGVVRGNFELVDVLSAERDKPVYAFANDDAYSAAYNIAAAADQVFVTRSGGVGSIGVVAMHMSLEKMLDQAGIKVTYIYAGKHKVDGNMAQDLPDDVKARFQERVDSLYSEFVGYVARNRGMSEEAVRNTEALTYDGQDGVDAGLADAVGSIAPKLAELEAEPMESHSMTTKSNAPAEATPSAITQDQLNAAVEAAKAEAMASGATAERTRIVAILTSDEAADRPQASMAAALETDMTALQAVAFLGKLPKEVAEAPEPKPAPKGGNVTPFDNAMQASGNPGVGAEPDGGEDEDEATPAAQSNSILNSLAHATGKRRKQA